MQVAVVHALATEILERAAIARIVAAMGVVPEARPSGTLLERSGTWVKESGVRLRGRAGKSKGGGNENRKSCACHAARPRFLRPNIYV